MSKKSRAPWRSKKASNDIPKIEYAGALKIPFLYRYLDFKLIEEKAGWQSGPELLRDILVNNRVRCSKPSNFNDPWDCRPCVHPDVFNDPVACSIMAESLIRTQRGGPHGDPLDGGMRRSPRVLKKVVDGYNDYFPTFIAEHWRILCLSEKSSSTLMWSHYSRNHQGICLEFAVDQTPFIAAMRVHYRAVYPKLILGTPEYENQMLTLKAECWRYENEFRMVSPVSKETTGSPESPLVLKDGFLDIGPALKSVIIGCQMAADAIDVVKSVMTESGTSVQLKRTVRAAYNFGLTTTPA